MSRLSIPFLILFSLYLSASAQKEDEALLRDALKNCSSAKLDQYCNTWRAESLPISNEELSKLNDTVREGYNLFTAYFNLRYQYKSLLTDQSHRNPFVKLDSFYVLLQNTLKISVSSDPNFHNKHQIDSIVFRHFSGTLPDSIKTNFYAADDELDSFIVSHKPDNMPRSANSSGDILIELRDQYYPRRSNDTKQERLIYSVENFKPLLNKELKVLYWTPEKCKVFVDLLRSVQDVATAQAVDDRQNLVSAIQLLCQKLAFFPASFSQTLPSTAYINNTPFNYVESIVFNKQMNGAVITTANPHLIRLEYWEKIKGEWSFITTVGSASIMY